jgi:transketolase
VITTQSRASMADWLFHEQAWDYALSSDRDGRWRTGGTVEEVIDEAGLGPAQVLEGIARFVRERERRLGSLEAALLQGRGERVPMA